MAAQGLLARIVDAFELDGGAQDRLTGFARYGDPAVEGSAEAFLEALESLGVRSELLRVEPLRALASARPGEPVLMFWSDGRTLLVDNWLLGRVRCDDGTGENWRSSDSLDLAAKPSLYALEPLLPASPMGGDRSPLSRLWSLIRLERQEVGSLVGFSVVVGVLALATPLAIQGLIGWLALGAPVQPVVGVALALVVVLGLAASLRTAQRVLVERLQRRIFVRMVQDLTARLPRVRIEALEKSHVPELVNRFFDVMTLQKAANSLLLEGVSAALQAIVGLLLLAIYHPLLLGVALLLVLSLVGLALLGRGGEKTAIYESKAKYRVAGWIEEIAQDPVLLQLAGAELAERRADELLHGYLQARSDHFRVFLRQFAGMQGIQVFLSVGLLFVCGWLVLEGELTLGQLVAAEFVVASSLAGFEKVVGKLDLWYDLLAGVDKLGSLVDLPTVREPTELRTGPVEVRLDEVSYSYPWGNAQLKDINIHLPAGSWTVLLGPAGSGKSTLAEIVCGVRNPSAGQVEVDGRPLELGDLRDSALLVRRGGIVAGTVRENLGLGRRPHDAESWSAIERVGLHTVIKGLKADLESDLWSGGAPLSGTQSTLLQIARVLVIKPRIVVFDCVIDALPLDLQTRVFRALSRLEITVLVLTEDAALAANFDRKVVLPGNENVAPS
ncbi:MAG: putative ABC transport system ATP-binding protein [Cognaticolwellia sp.]|jgi:putative ABC transport system ATP-binding protein